MTRFPCYSVQIFKDFYSAEEFAALKKVSLRTVYTWTSKGIAPAFEMVGGMYWFYKKTANAWTPPPRGRKAKE